MAAINFPNAPTGGQQFAAPNGVTYTWDGAAWTVATGGGGGAPSGPAGGSLTGTYPNPTLAVTGVVPGVWGSATNVARTTVAADGRITTVVLGGLDAATINAGEFPTARYADVSVTNAKIADVAYAKVTGAPTALPPSGTATGDLTGTYPAPTIGALKVTDAKINDVAATKLTGTIAQAQLPVSPSGLLTANLNDAQVTDAKIAGMAYGKLTGAPAAQWTTDATESMLHPIPAAYGLRWGSVTTVRSRLVESASKIFDWRANWNAAGTPDDAASASQLIQLQAAGIVVSQRDASGVVVDGLQSVSDGTLVARRRTAAGLLRLVGTTALPAVNAQLAVIEMKGSASNTGLGTGNIGVSMIAFADETWTASIAGGRLETRVAQRGALSSMKLMQTINQDLVTHETGIRIKDIADTVTAAGGQIRYRGTALQIHNGTAWLDVATLVAGALTLGSTQRVTLADTGGLGDLSYNNPGSAGYTTASAGLMLRFDPGTNATYLVRFAPTTGAATFPFTFSGDGNLTITGATATKASGTTWANPSDERLKKNVAPYAAGLAELLQLAPITYQHNGLGGTRDDGTVCYGLSAQAVQPIMPEMVSVRLAKLGPDDVQEIEILSLDASPMLFAMLNALRELHARLAAVEVG